MKSNIIDINYRKKKEEDYEDEADAINEYTSNYKMSMEAFRLGVYLFYYHKNKVLNVKLIKDFLKCGDFVWRRVSKELRAGGYLRIRPGRTKCGESSLEFDIHGRYKKES